MQNLGVCVCGEGMHYGKCGSKAYSWLARTCHPSKSGGDHFISNSSLTDFILNIYYGYQKFCTVPAVFLFKKNEFTTFVTWNCFPFYLCIGLEYFHLTLFRPWLTWMMSTLLVQYIIEWVGGTVSERPRNILELKPANFSLNCFSRFEGSYVQKLYW